jgi:hypothetical protein
MGRLLLTMRGPTKYTHPSRILPGSTWWSLRRRRMRVPRRMRIRNRKKKKSKLIPMT